MKTIYSLGGLRIACDIPLSGLQVFGSDEEKVPDVVMRQEIINGNIPPNTTTIADGTYSGTYDGSNIVIEYSNVGKFLLHAGEEILIDLISSADEDEVQAFLLGAVFGGLCQQRGITPLHASAIDTGDGCVAFVGASGAGKSTLAAALARRGYTIMADDECFITRCGRSGAVQAWPGIIRVRLWEDARSALRFEPQIGETERQRLAKHLVKHSIPVQPLQNPNWPRPLRAVYQVHQAADEGPLVTRLWGADAVEALMQNVYPPGFAAQLGYEAHVFAVCAAVANNVPVFKLGRPHNFAALEQCLDVLESSLREFV